MKPITLLLSILLSIVASISCFAQSDDLMIVEYADWDTGEGMSLTLFNPTCDTISLSNYQIAIYQDGSTVPFENAVLRLRGRINPGGTYIIKNYATSPASFTSCPADTVIGGVIGLRLGQISGNDALVLSRFPDRLNFVDMIGWYGSDYCIEVPGSCASSPDITARINGVANGLFRNTIRRVSNNATRYTRTNGSTINSWPNYLDRDFPGWQSVGAGTCVGRTFQLRNAAQILPSDSVICATPVTAFTLRAGTGNNYQWFRNGNLLPNNTDTLIVNDLGTYVFVKNSCIRNLNVFTTDTFRLIQGTPQAKITGPPVNVKLGDLPWIFSSKSVVGSTYEWFISGTSGCTFQGQINQPNVNVRMGLVQGTDTLILRQTFPGSCIDTDTLIFTVFSESATTPIQTGDDLLIVEYADWNVGGGLSATIYNPTCDTIDLSRYMVTLQAAGSLATLGGNIIHRLNGLIPPANSYIFKNSVLIPANFLACEADTAFIEPRMFGLTGNSALVLRRYPERHVIVDMVGWYANNYCSLSPNPCVVGGRTQVTAQIDGVQDGIYLNTVKRDTSNLVRYTSFDGTSANSWPRDFNTNFPGWISLGRGVCVGRTFSPSVNPPRNFLPADSQVCSLPIIPFTIDAGNSTTYTWTKNSINISNSRTITISDTGTYIVSKLSCIGTPVVGRDTFRLILAPPSFRADLPNLPFICSGYSSSIIMRPSEAGNYRTTWNLRSNRPNPSRIAVTLDTAVSIIYGSPGIDTLYSSTSKDNQCFVKDTLVITVRPHPSQPSKPSGDTSFCPNPGPKTYKIDTVEASTTINWVLNPSNAGTIVSAGDSVVITFTPNFTGTIYLKANGENTCSASNYSDSLRIRIEGAFINPPTKPLGDSAICGLGRQRTYRTSNFSTTDTLDWQVNPVNAASVVANGDSAVLTFQTTFTGNLILKVMSRTNCGISGFSDSLSIRIIDGPGQPFKPTSTSFPRKRCISNQTPISISSNLEANGISWRYEVIPSSAGTISDTGAQTSFIPNGSYLGPISIRYRYLTDCGFSTFSDTLQFQVNPNPVASAGIDSSVCDNNLNLYANTTKVGETGNWIILTGTGGVISNAQMPNSNFSGIIGQNYQLVWNLFDNTAGCVDSDTIEIYFKPQENITVGQDLGPLCNFSTNITAVSQQPGTWRIIGGSGGFLENPNSLTTGFTGLEGSTYTLVFESNTTNSCGKSADTLSVNFAPSVSATANIGNTTSQGIGLIGNGGTTYQWSPSDNLTSTNTKETVYTGCGNSLITLQVTNEFGCTDTTTILAIGNGTLNFPTAFSPNGDLINDIWQTSAVNISQEVKVQIINRWGALVYEYFGNTPSWDGKLNGETLPAGVYAYIIDSPQCGGVYKGTILLTK